MKIPVLMAIMFVVLSVFDLVDAYNASKEMVRIHLMSATISITLASSCFILSNIMSLRERLDKLEKKQ